MSGHVNGGDDLDQLENRGPAMTCCLLHFLIENPKKQKFVLRLIENVVCISPKNGVFTSPLYSKGIWLVLLIFVLRASLAKTTPGRGIDRDQTLGPHRKDKCSITELPLPNLYYFFCLFLGDTWQYSWFTPGFPLRTLLSVLRRLY